MTTSPVDSGEGFEILPNRGPPEPVAGGRYEKDHAVDGLDLRSKGGTLEELALAEDSVEVSAVGGMAVADLDGDDTLDLVPTDRDAAVTLLIGDGDGGFERGDPVARGLPEPGPLWSGVSAVDWDGDGDLDLAFFGQEDRLFRNDGRVVLSDTTSGTDWDGAQEFTISTSWADPDRDGDLDAYQANGGFGAEGHGDAAIDPDRFLVQEGPGGLRSHPGEGDRTGVGGR